jgi:hypothetical protein
VTVKYDIYFTSDPSTAFNSWNFKTKAQLDQFEKYSLNTKKIMNGLRFHLPNNITHTTNFEINLMKKIFIGLQSGKKVFGIPISFENNIIEEVIFNKAIQNTKYGYV